MTRTLTALALGVLAVLAPTTRDAAASPLSKAALEIVEQSRRNADDVVRRSMRHVEGRALDRSLGFSSAAFKEAVQSLPEVDQETVIFLLRRHRLEDLIPAQEAQNAIEFLVRTGDDGAVIMKRFGWQGAQDRGLTNEGREEVVREAGRLIRPGLDGSWVALREAMSRAGVAGRGRDFAEELFLDRARAGRIAGLEDAEIFEAQYNGINGLDFLAVEEGRIRVIEFGTGRKPSRSGGQGVGVQMDWSWVEKNLQAYIRSIDEDTKIALRAAGFPNNILLRPEDLTGERLRALVRREIYAVERDEVLFRRLGNDVLFQCLEEFRGCAAKFNQAG